MHCSLVSVAGVAWTLKSLTGFIFYLIYLILTQLSTVYHLAAILFPSAQSPLTIKHSDKLLQLQQQLAKHKPTSLYNSS